MRTTTTTVSASAATRRTSRPANTVPVSLLDGKPFDYRAMQRMTIDEKAAFVFLHFGDAAIQFNPIDGSADVYSPASDSKWTIDAQGRCECPASGACWHCAYNALVIEAKREARP